MPERPAQPGLARQRAVLDPIGEMASTRWFRWSALVALVGFNLAPLIGWVLR